MNELTFEEKKKILLSDMEKSNIKILNTEDSLNLIKSGKSIARLGDGELDIIKGKSFPFQRYNQDLTAQLVEILGKKQDFCLVGIPDAINNFDNLTQASEEFWVENMYSTRNAWIEYLNEDMTYCTANITRLYMRYKDKSKCKMYFDMLKDIYKDFFKSSYAKYKLEIKNTKVIGYDDALLISYLKGKLFGFPYNNYIKQVVIDEAQDYNYLQYVIIKEMFKKADFTILGDVNQNINPYYKYDSLEELKEIFSDSNYLELLKTYRSTKEIIEYTNRILNLDYVNAIKKSNNKDVIIRKRKGLKESLLTDIDTLTDTYKSLAIITKEDGEAEVIYDLLKDNLNISLLTEESKTFIKDLVVVPSYIAKGLEFDSVIIIDSDWTFKKNKYLYYVACTRAREELIIYE